MITFLPFANFAQSVAALDSKRLFKQVIEAYQLKRSISGVGKTGWAKHHPMAKMWIGYMPALRYYRRACIEELHPVHSSTDASIHSTSRCLHPM